MDSYIDFLAPFLLNKYLFYRTLPLIFIPLLFLLCLNLHKKRSEPFILILKFDKVVSILLAKAS